MDQATINAYDKYAKEYDDEVVEFWDNFPKMTVDEFCQRLNGKKVLDLGSGSGRDAVILRNQGLEVTCLDASKEMAKITRQLGFETIAADFLTMKLEPLEYDGIWAYTSLLHLPQEEVIEVLNRIFTSLKPGGVFLIGMIEGKFEGEVERENMPGEKRFFRFYEEGEIREIIERAGFKFIFQERYKPHSKTYLAQIFTK